MAWRPGLLGLLALMAGGASAQSKYSSWTKASPSRSLQVRTMGITAVNSTGLLAIGGKDDQGNVLDSVMAFNALVPQTSAFGEASAGNVFKFDRSASTQAQDGRVWVFGGVDPTTNRETANLYQLSVNGAPTAVMISNVTTAGSPSARKSATITYLSNCNSTNTQPTGECLVVVGGDAAGVKPADVNIFWLQTRTWSKPTNAQLNAPTGRSNAAAVPGPDGSQVLVFGGDAATGTSNDLYAFAPNGFSDFRTTEATNIALNAYTFQSTTDYFWGTAGPGRAVDGNINTNSNANWGSAGNMFMVNTNFSAQWVAQRPDPLVYNWCTATWDSPYGSSTCNSPTNCNGGQGTTDPWWAVDLGSVQNIDFLSIYGRTDCCSGRNAGFKLYYGNTNTSLQWNDPSVKEYVHGFSDLTTTNVIIPTPGIQARYIWYRLPGAGRILTLCEFQVWQKKPFVWRKLSGTFNAAFNKYATQSSTMNGWSNGYAGRAVDGIQTNNYDAAPSSCMHTGNTELVGTYAYWMVDLGDVYDVQSMDVWARTDCCTNRNVGFEWLVGMSTDHTMDSKCANGLATLAPPGGLGSVSFTCPLRGRYVFARKYISTFNVDPNFIMLCEVQVNANMLANQPGPRSGAAIAIYAGMMMVFGGSDSSGFRLNEMRMFDIVNNKWIAGDVYPIAGSLPPARSFGFMAPMPNSTLTGVSLASNPGNSIALFGGQSATDTLNDLYLLTFPQCPAVDKTGVDTEICSGGGTICYYKCASYATSQNGNKPLVCRPDGMWDGVQPPCLGAAPGAPTAVTATVVNSTTVAVGWTAPSSTGYYSPLTQYRVQARTNDMIDSFAGSTFGASASSWSWTQPGVSTFYNAWGWENGMLRIDGAAGANTWFDERNAPQWVRSFPSNVDAGGSWAAETYVEADMDKTIMQLWGMIGMEIFDQSEYSGGGVGEAWVGFRRVDWAAGQFEVGLESSINAFNNYFNAGGRSSGYLRLEKDNAASSSNPTVRAFYKYRASDNWFKCPMEVTYSQFRNGGIPTASTKIGLTTRNWNGGSRLVARFGYLRIAPLDCSAPGTDRIVTSSVTSVNVAALTPSAQYTFAVAAATRGGFGPWSTPTSLLTLPSAVSAAAVPTINVALNKPCWQSTLPGWGTACSAAIDADATNTFCHTDNTAGDGEFITIDLGIVTSVKSMLVAERNDCCQSRGDFFEVYVGNDGSVNGWTTANRCDKSLIPTTMSVSPYQVTFPCILTGRYVTIHQPPSVGWPRDGFLHYRDVKVFAANSCPARTATGATQVTGTNCANGAGWGAVCTHACNPGYVQVTGTTTSTCNGEVWDAPSLVCAPTCTDLIAPSYVSQCAQTYFTESFTDPVLSVARMVSLDPISQAIGKAWTVNDGMLQGSSKLGCSSDLHLMIASPKIKAYASQFYLQADVTASGTGRVGLVWRAQDKLNMYRLWMDPAVGIVVMEKVIGGLASKLVDATMSIQAGKAYTVRVTTVQNQINVTINGRQTMFTYDKTFTVGYAGVYAQTVGYFDNVIFSAICGGVANGATDGDVATFTCNNGMIAVGPASRTCVQSGSSSYWTPGSDPLITVGSNPPSYVPFYCTLPPPVFIPSILAINENSIKNSNVGDSLIGYTSSPDYQVQWQIINTMDKFFNAIDNTIFWIDVCSGQVKVRQPILDFETMNQYVLTIRAFVFGFTGAETVRNITVNINNVNEPPILYDTTFYINENSPSGMPIGRISWWDPENDTVTWTIDVDAAYQRLSLNATTGMVSVAPAKGNVSTVLNFEDLVIQPPEYDLNVKATETSQAVPLRTTGKVIVLLNDINDQPLISFPQLLNVMELGLTAGTTVATTVASDEDQGAFKQNLTYTMLPYSNAAVASICKITDAKRYATLDNMGGPTGVGSVGGTPLFSLSSLNGALSIPVLPDSGTPGQKSFIDQTPFVAQGNLVRQWYTICVNVTDGMSFDVKPINVAIVANVPAIPQILNISGAVTMSTNGLEWVYFGGSGFCPNNLCNSVVRAWYANAALPALSTFRGAWSYNATNCSVVSPSQIKCLTVPGVGFGFSWKILMGTTSANAVEIVQPGTAPLLTSYGAPSVTGFTYSGTGAGVVVGGVVVALPTVGNQYLRLTGRNFGPPCTPVLFQYGLNYEFSCNHAMVCTPTDLTTNTVSRQYSPLVGSSGAGLPWRITVGGQTVNGWNTISHAPPVIYNISAISAGTDLKALDTSGGETIQLRGDNFGPPGAAISVTYGTSTGSLLTLANCNQGTGGWSHNMITCQTVAGVGKDHGVKITVSQVAATSVYGWNGTLSFVNNTLAYKVPIVTRLYGPGVTNADTTGGALVFIEGQNFGPISYPVATIDSVTYGKPPVGYGLYTAQNCKVVQVPPATPLIQCQLGAGVGAGHKWMVTVGSQQSAVYQGQTTSYAAPQVLGFSDVGADLADTVGGQSIVITGRNYGPMDAYTNSLLAAHYGTELTQGPVKLVDFNAANCQITIAHTQLTCFTAEGAGKDLQWKVIVDSQESRQPTTNYAPPEVTGIVKGDGSSAPVDAANVNGGDLVFLLGNFMGPQTYAPANASLVQWVKYGLSGSEYTVPKTGLFNWTSNGHHQIAVYLPPGVGRNLHFTVSVADQQSMPSTATFSYAVPAILAIVPARAHTYSDPRKPTIVTLVTQNMPLMDTSVRYQLLFGGIPTSDQLALTLPVILPSGVNSIASATNDGAFWPAGSINASFALPKDHAGAELAVRIKIFQGANTQPIITTAVTVAGANIFSYFDPVINNVIVTRPTFYNPSDNTTVASGDMIECPWNSNLDWNCTDPALLQLTVIGSDFALDPELMDHNDGVVRSMELLTHNYTYLNIPGLGEVWSDDDVYWWKWGHSQIVAFTHTPASTIRVKLTSCSSPAQCNSWSGNATQQSVAYPYANLNPSIGAIRGAISNIPTTGSVAGQPLVLDVTELAGATDLIVLIDGNPATIVGSDGMTAIPVTNAINSWPYQPVNGINTWTVRVLAPAGQGKGVTVQVVRITNTQADPSNTGFTVDYAPPTFSQVGVEIAGVNTWYPVNFFTTITVPTDGSAIVRIKGSNLGTFPRVIVGDGYVLSMPAVRNCTNVGINAQHTCYEINAVAGEGTGLLFDEYQASRGFQVFLEAGNQDSAKVGYKYALPTVTSVVSSTPGYYPTQGGNLVSVNGANFGTKAPARLQDSIVQVFFGRPADGLASYVECTNVVRISHTVINCTLPEGSGMNLGVRVTIADQTNESPSIFSYNKPVIANSSIYRDVKVHKDVNGTVDYFVYGDNTTVIYGTSLTGAASGPVVDAMDPMSWSIGDVITVTGSNFGKRADLLHCAFMTWSYRRDDANRAVKRACNNGEDFLGEGEISYRNVIAWDHGSITFIVPAGLGHKEIELSVRGNTLNIGRYDASLVKFTYAAPVITSMTPSHGNTEGAQNNGEGLVDIIITLSGSNFGVTPRNMTIADNRLGSETFSTPVPLEAAASLPTAYVVISFHTMCLTNARDFSGNVPDASNLVPTRYSLKSISDCVAYPIASHSPNQIKFKLPSGVGLNRNVTVHVIERTPVPAVPDYGSARQSSNSMVFNYDAPRDIAFNPSRVYVDKRPAFASNTITRLTGMNFGDYSQADAQGWTDVEKYYNAQIAGFDCVGMTSDPLSYRSRGGNPLRTILQCVVNTDRVTAGWRNATVEVAGQIGFADATEDTGVEIVCFAGSYGRINETCLACPTVQGVQGAECPGFIDNHALPYEQRFGYPIPKEGWYNLNSSDRYVVQWGAPGETMMTACPDGFQDHGRDVCIVPCDPPESCLGDNNCAYGYTSKSPMWRCSSCDKGFYKRSGECIKCPDSPAGLFIGFIALVIFVGFIGFMLNRKQVNIAVISIGVDFFQVLAIFSQTRVKWPPVIKELLHVLSAFNLNIEIVAPECLIPDVSYQQKFWFIMLLPLSVGFLLLGGIFTSLFFYKACIKGLPKKKWFTHTSTLVSSTMILIYLLYLYLTRTILDVFNCTPTMPPDGYTYLSVVFERCGVPGGTQMTLLPYAIAGLIVYTFGYPAFVGYTLYKNRELVMEDQLLRAKGLGNDRLSNPHAYSFRRMFGRSYFQFKPDVCMWIVMIVLRKFFIALTAVIFNKNSSFQMAACLLVMFIAYSLQMSWRPYMSPGDYDEVLRTHVESSYTSAIHARLRTALSNIETRGRKKVRKNLLNFDGKVDRSAVLGILTGWLFNYNTVEQIMIFAAVIVCLMGIMYQANEVNTYYPESKDSVTAVVLAVIILAILYFVTVLITEIVVLYNEEARLKQLSKQAKAGKLSTKAKSSSSDNTQHKGKLVGDDGEINVGKMDTQMNPLFMNASGNGANAVAGDGIGLEAIMAQRTSPPPELWSMFQQSFGSMASQVTALQEQLAEAKKREALGGSRGSAEVDDTSSAPSSARKKAAFGPQAAGVDAASASSSQNPLANFKRQASSGGAALSSLRKSKATA